MDDVKEELKLDSENINLKVFGLDGTDVQFKIKKDTPMRKLMKAYIDRKGLAADAIRFLFEGERVLPSSTPKSLGICEGDTIEIVQEQISG